MGKGAGILFIGTILGIFFNFLLRVAITRFYTPSDYGMFNLYYTILSIFAAAGSIGLRSGIQRNVSYYLGKDEKEKVSAVISWGLAIGLAGGIIFGLGLFLFSGLMAPLFSDNPVLGFYFKLAAITVPFFVINHVLISVFRGFQRTKERIFFRDVGRHALMLASVLLVGIWALPFENVILGISIVLISLALIFIFYYLTKGKQVLDIKKAFKWNSKIGKKLLIFSLPLLLVDIMFKVMGWTDTVMIGYFLTEDSVGFYNVAKPLSKFISTALTVSIFIYAPLASSLYAQKREQENKVIFTTITKWICFGSLPIVLVFLFYPRWVIGFLFGAEYEAATIPLQILAITYFFKNLMGPNRATLTAYGKTKFLMYATSAAALLNVMLNGLLIPFYGIVGAAIATGFSLVIINVIRVKKMKDISGMHSVKPNILKPTFLTIGITFGFVYVLRFVLPINLISILLSAVSFYFIFFLSLILTKSISKDDIKILLLIEKKVGLNLSFIKNILRKFI